MLVSVGENTDEKAFSCRNFVHGVVTANVAFAFMFGSVASVVLLFLELLKRTFKFFSSSLLSFIAAALGYEDSTRF